MWSINRSRVVEDGAKSYAFPAGFGFARDFPCMIACFWACWFCFFDGWLVGGLMLMKAWWWFGLFRRLVECLAFDGGLLVGFGMLEVGAFLGL